MHETKIAAQYNCRYLPNRANPIMSFGPTELLIILAIVLLVFGSKRIGSLGSDLGRAIKGFRRAVKSEPGESAGTERVIEGEATETDSNKS